MGDKGLTRPASLGLSDVPSRACGHFQLAVFAPLAEEGRQVCSELDVLLAWLPAGNAGGSTPCLQAAAAHEG